MNTRIMRIAMITLVSSLMLATASYGERMEGKQGREPRGKSDHKGGMGAMREIMFAKILENPAVAEELGLTEEQVKKLKDGMYQLRRKEIELRADQELAAMDQARLMTEEDIDEKALMKAIEKTGAINTEMAKLRTKQLLLVKQNLSREQLQKIRKMVRKKMDKKGGKGGRGEEMRRKHARPEQSRGRDGENHEELRERRKKMQAERRRRAEDDADEEEDKD